MGRFFDIDGPFLGGLTKMADVFILNLLLILCSLPIFTFGAAYTALYYVTLKMVKDEECYIAKAFFKSFKQNFKQATIIWFIVLAIGTVIYVDFKVINGGYAGLVMPQGIAKVMYIIVMASLILFSFTSSYVFPLLARFDNSVKNTLKNAMFMSIRHFPSTILIIIINVLPFVVMYFVPKALILVFFVFGLCAYCNSSFFVKIFKLYTPEEKITSDEEFEVNVNDNK